MAFNDNAPRMPHTRRSSSPTSTFSSYYDAYAARQIWAPQSARAVDLAARTFPYRNLPLRHLTHAHIEMWVRHMYDDGLAPATTRTRVSHLRAVLYGAIRDGLITDNPVVGVRLPRATARATSAKLPTASQVAALIATSPPPYDRLFALAAYAGLRLGEARALSWDDVDLEARTLTVRRQVQQSPGGGHAFVPPKYGSYRTVPISDELMAVLTPVRADQHNLVTGNPRGTPLHPGSVHRIWSRQADACGLPEGLRLHDLRHLYASTLIADGINILTVQRRLGHTRASTTLDVYAHAIGSAL